MKGALRPNYSHVLGVFAAAALSNLYYPKESRGLGLTLVNGAMETVGILRNEHRARVHSEGNHVACRAASRSDHPAMARACIND